MEKLILQSEVVGYTDKNGNQREYTNLYVEVKLGSIITKVGLKTIDRTGQELISAVLSQNK